jgi:hypothetical protein
VLAAARLLLQRRQQQQASFHSSSACSSKGIGHTWVLQIVQTEIEMYDICCASEI